MTDTFDPGYWAVVDDWRDQYKKKKKKGKSKICECCGERKAVYYSQRSKKRKSKKRVRTGKFHTLCLQCYAAELDRERANRAAEADVRSANKADYDRTVEEMRETFHERSDKKRSFKRARRRWSKALTLSRAAGRRNKVTCVSPYVW